MAANSKLPFTKVQLIKKTIFYFSVCFDKLRPYNLFIQPSRPFVPLSFLLYSSSIQSILIILLFLFFIHPIHPTHLYFFLSIPTIHPTHLSFLLSIHTIHPTHLFFILHSSNPSWFFPLLIRYISSSLVHLSILFIPLIRSP